MSSRSFSAGSNQKFWRGLKQSLDVDENVVADKGYPDDRALTVQKRVTSMLSYSRKFGPGIRSLTAD